MPKLHFTQADLTETESIPDYAYAHKTRANSDAKANLLSMLITVAYKLSQNLIQDASSTNWATACYTW